MDMKSARFFSSTNLSLIWSSRCHRLCGNKVVVVQPVERCYKAWVDVFSKLWLKQCGILELLVQTVNWAEVANRTETCHQFTERTGTNKITIFHRRIHSAPALSPPRCVTHSNLSCITLVPKGYYWNMMYRECACWLLQVRDAGKWRDQIGDQVGCSIEWAAIVMCLSPPGLQARIFSETKDRGQYVPTHPKFLWSVLRRKFPGPDMLL